MMKTEPAKTVPIPSLRSVTSNVSPRFITTPVSSNINTVPLTIQNTGGKPITIPSSGGQTGHKSDVTIAVLPMANRIIPASGTGYHVPRGPATVANISVPRASLATPIRGSSNSAGNSSFMPGLSVLRPLGAGPWIVTTSGNTPPTSIRPITSTVAPSNFIPATVRHSSMTVAAKMSPGPRMQSDQNPRPQTVLLQKQIITGANTSQMVHVTDGSKGFIKTALRTPSPRLLSTSAPGNKLPVFPILVPSGASILKTQGPTQIGNKVMVSQATHGTPIQITSVPNPSSTKSSGFQPTSSSHLTSTVPPTSLAPSPSLPGKPPLHPVIVSSAPPSLASSQQNITFSKYPNVISTSNSSSFTPVSSNAPPQQFYYESAPSTASSLPPSSLPSSASYPLTPNTMGVRHGGNFSPMVTSLAHPRPNQTSTIISAPRAGGLAQFTLPINRLSQPSVLVASNRPHLITSSPLNSSGSSTIVTTGPPGITRFSPISGASSLPMMHEAQARQSSVQHGVGTTFVPVSCEGSGDESSNVQNTLSSSAIKPNASPRPSILRKREIDPCTPLKAQKNLTPLILNAVSNASVSNMITSISNVATNSGHGTINSGHTGINSGHTSTSSGHAGITSGHTGINSGHAVSNSGGHPSSSGSSNNITSTINSVASNMSAINVANTISSVASNATGVALPTSPSSPPKRPDSGSGSSSQSSSSSTSSGSSTQPADPLEGSMAPAPALPHDTEPGPPHANTSALISGLSLSNCPVEMSPRKKPRKQLLTGDLQERKMEVEDMEFITEEKIKSDHHRDENGGSSCDPSQGSFLPPSHHSLPPPEAPAAQQKPHVSLLHSYRQGWKSRHHHFMRYSDVKPKDERRPSLSDIASQRQILQKVNGWKIYHLRTQMENMATSEKEHSSKLTCLLETFEKKYDSNDREVNRVNELIKGNIQRNNVVQDQLMEAHGHLMKIFEHKNTVTDLITKNGNRRTIKKKDKY